MPEKVEVQRDRCKGCGLCVEFCPKHCLKLSEELNAIGYHPAELHNADECSACAICANMCPEGGMSVYRPKRRKKSG
ncbi:MAG: ferredoxin family protein [Planctomycetota bacterium]|nr:MAG: ferredoxin family protein [Planctomycetota bacterium]